MGCEGEEDWGGRGWEAVDMMVLWVIAVDTVREDFWGVMEDDIMIFLGDGSTVEGGLGVEEVISGAVGGFTDNLEGAFEEELMAKEGSTEVAGKVDTD